MLSVVATRRVHAYVTRDAQFDAFFRSVAVMYMCVI